MNEHQLIDTLHRVRDEIVVGPPPILQVTANATRRHRTRMTIAAGVAAAACVAGVVVAVQHGDDDGRPEPARQVDNPAPVAWWGDGVLHVRHAEVEMAQPWMMVDVGDGVVTQSQPADGETRASLTYVTDKGIEVPVGTRSSDQRLIADPGYGWVAWADGPANGPTELVVYDVLRDVEIGRRELPAGGPRDQLPGGSPRPIALEDGVVYYAGWGGDYRWDVARGADPRPVTDADTYLMDVEAGVQLILGGNDAVVLSPDGRYSMSQSGIGNRIRVFDVATGDRLPTGLAADPTVDSFAFGSDGTVVYVISTPWTRPDDFDPSGPPPTDFTLPPYTLISCEIATASCQTVVDDIGGDEDVVLAQ